MRAEVRRCVVIPAIKKSAAIPDQLVKKLHGKTLIQRALDTAVKVVPAEDIIVVTDSDEIRLICERNRAGYVFDPAFSIATLNIVSALEPVLRDLAGQYGHLIIYRASAPLITQADIEDAYGVFWRSGADCLVTVKSVPYRFWEGTAVSVENLLKDRQGPSALIEVKALVMLQASVFAKPAGQILEVEPYYLHDRSVEITGYQDWWVCEKLLARKHIVFVVAGYPAIGMGHVYRSLMLAHEIGDHRITFVCTRQSELAVSNIAAREYRTVMQAEEDLAVTVLAQAPDLVVNDMLDTCLDYMQTLKEAGCRAVNFEDQGPGAELADLVVNALYDPGSGKDSRSLYGHQYYCLRDEFLDAAKNTMRERPARLLITFGGTDHRDFSGATLGALYRDCLERDIKISVVTGPGYAHLTALQERIAGLNRMAEASRPGPQDGSGPFITFTHATNVMSRMMEGVDLAVSTAGRTVYELAHMRIPAIVFATHPREDAHVFARPCNGFVYLGLMEHFDEARVRGAFLSLLSPGTRQEMHLRQSVHDFTRNKERVVNRILDLIPGSDTLDSQ